MTNRVLFGLKLLAAATVLSLATFSLPQGADAQSSTAQVPDRIDEEMFVPIGGIDQWITIKGDDRKNPVVLFLHGGPGDANSPFADAMFAGWEKDFTLVQWDQRGAGRTYGKTGPSVEPTMTVERMAQDGIEVAGFLRTHLNKRKIIIVGQSWGSVLGIHMAHARPELFYAYVGLAQIVSPQKNLSAGYARVLQLARAAHDQPAIAALMALGAPPWDTARKWPLYRKWQRFYQAKIATEPPAPETLAAAYATPQEQDQYAAADDFSFLHFWGMKLSGPLWDIDLSALGDDFEVPIFVFQGAEDLTAPPELAKAYFDSIKAPYKRFYLLPGTGHGQSVAELDLVRKVLTEEVRPTALVH